jgi:hypothetical protein
MITTLFGFCTVCCAESKDPVPVTETSTSPIDKNGLCLLFIVMIVVLIVKGNLKHTYYLQVSLPFA